MMLTDRADEIAEIKADAEESDDMPDPYKSGRERGILTKGDRNYLIGGPDESLSTAGEQQRRFELRKRAINSIVDFTILMDQLEDRDRIKIQEETDPTDAVAFLLGPYVREIADAPKDSPKASGATRDFYANYLADRLEAAINRAFEVEVGDGWDVDIEITDIEAPDQGSPSPEEIETLIQVGGIEPEEIREMYDQGSITLRQLTQLTRNGRLFAKDDLTDEAYRELLEKTPDFLDDDSDD